MMNKKFEKRFDRLEHGMERNNQEEFIFNNINKLALGG